MKHEIALLSKKNLSAKAPGASGALSTPEAAAVYRMVATGPLVKADGNPWLRSEFTRLGVAHPLEINSGTLGQYRANLGKLKDKGVITQSEQEFLEDALEVLGDVRRNVDAHVFLKVQVGGSMQGDLTDVYIPACNILIDAFER